MSSISKTDLDMIAAHPSPWRLPGLDKIGSDQLNAVLRATTASILCALANAVLIIGGLWGAAPRGVLLPWLAYALAVTAAVSLRRGRSSKDDRETVSPHTVRRVVIATTLLASPWAVLSVVFLGNLPPGAETMLITACAGMAAGGGILLAQVYPAALAFVGVVLVPFAIKCFWLVAHGYGPLGLLAVSYAAFLYAVIATTARLSAERSDALRKLSQSAQELSDRERLISAQNKWFDTALNNMTQGLCFFDADERLIVCNRRYVDIHGLPPERIVPGVRLSEIVSMRSAIGSLPTMSEADYLSWRRAANAENQPSNTVFRLGDGRVFSVHYRPMPGGAWVATTDDITERHSLGEQLARNHQLLTERTNVLQAIVDNFPGGIGFYDRNLRIAVCNRRARDLLELPEHLFRDGAPHLEDVLRFNAARGEYGPGEVEALVAEKLSLVSDRKSYHFQRVRPNGTVLDVHGAPVEGGGFIATYMDVTERYRSEARIAHMAKHDALTGLPNRVLFRERLDAALENMVEDRGVAVLMLDLDRFKQVNDNLGHPFGDAVLKCVADRLTSSVRSEDLVARLGGDEFAVVIHALNAVAEAEATAARVQAVLEMPFALDQQHADIGVSIGIAMADTANEDADELIKRADIALYSAKKCGAAYRIYAADMRDREPQAARQHASAA